MTTPSDNTPESSDLISERAVIEALRSVPQATDETREAHIFTALSALSGTTHRRPPKWLSVAAASVVLVAGGALAGRALSDDTGNPDQLITRNEAIATTVERAGVTVACMAKMQDATYISTTLVSGIEIALFLDANNALLAIRLSDCAEIGSLDISNSAP